MLAYGVVGSNRVDEARTFYDALLGTIGMTKMFDHPTGGRVYRDGSGNMFGFLGPYDGEAATVGNGSMFAFGLDSREAVSAFHARAIELGGSCDGPPGLRGREEMGMFFTYVRDPEGNKLCAFKMG